MFFKYSASVYLVLGACWLLPKDYSIILFRSIHIFVNVEFEVTASWISQILPGKIVSFSDRVHTFLGHHNIFGNKLKPGFSIRSLSICLVLYLPHRCVPWLVTDQKFSCFCRLNGKILAILLSWVNIVNLEQELIIIRVAGIGTL